MDINHMPNDIQQLIAQMNQEVRDKLAEAVELGKWQDGTKLSTEQLEHCMRAVMLWDSQYGQEQDEPFKVLRGGRLIDRVAKQEQKPNNNDDQIDIRLQ